MDVDRAQVTLAIPAKAEAYSLHPKINQLIEFKLCTKINQLLPSHLVSVRKSKIFISSIPLTYLSTNTNLLFIRGILVSYPLL